MSQDAIVLGAGMVGVSVALHLRRRGWDVVLVDRNGPGEGTSFGNAGLIQREAVFPAPFPRDISTLSRVVANRAIDVAYHLDALPGLAAPLLRYWHNSAPSRYATAVAGHAALIATCLDEHRAVATEAGATDLLRPIGYLRLFSTAASLESVIKDAELAHRDHGVNYRVLDPAGLAELEPHLQSGKAGAIHWTDPYSVSDPHALTTAYAGLFHQLGGRSAVGDAATLAQHGAAWQVQTEDGPVTASQAVVALGMGSAKLTQRFGWAAPLFGKRGYHVHYGLRGNAVLNHPMLDGDNGYMLIPMRAGVRLTTGAEFTRSEAEATPVQLERADPVARGLLPLGERVESTPWMGVRPCTPDMLPVIGRAPGQASLWCAFGHAHQGLTLGPSTGRLLAEIMTGEQPYLDPAPYRAERFN